MRARMNVALGITEQGFSTGDARAGALDHLRPTSAWVRLNRLR